MASFSLQSTHYQFYKEGNRERIVALLLISLPILLVGSAICFYAVNLPYWDDYMVQKHLLLLKNCSGREKIVHFFDQYWEYRIVWTRLVFAAFAKVNGSLNYYGLTLVGTGGLLAILGILFAGFRQLRFPLLYFVPIPFLFFSLQSYENLIWAMASISNFWVLTFALGAFYLLSLTTRIARNLALSVVYLGSLNHWRTSPQLPKVLLGIIITTICHSLLYNYVYLEALINQHRRTKAEYFNYVANTPSDKQQAIGQLFTPTVLPFFINNITSLTQSTWLTTPPKTAIGPIDDQVFMYNMSKADAPNPTISQPEAGSYIFLKSSEFTYLFAAQPTRAPFANRNYFNTKGFKASVLKEKLEPGQYHISVLTHQNNHINLAMTNRYLIFVSS